MSVTFKSVIIYGHKLDEENEIDAKLDEMSHEYPQTVKDINNFILADPDNTYVGVTILATDDYDYMKKIKKNSFEAAKTKLEDFYTRCGIDSSAVKDDYYLMFFTE